MHCTVMSFIETLKGVKKDTAGEEGGKESLEGQNKGQWNFAGFYGSSQ